MAKSLEYETINDYRPLPIDWALHGRPIHETPYANLWRQTLAVIASFATGTLYLGLRDSTVCFSLYKGSTACINLITKDIFINPIFLRKWTVTPTDLAFILMHEAFHPLIDPDKSGKVTQKYNICSDALINSIIFRISPALVSLPRKFYSENVFPGCLLRSGTSKIWRRAASEPSKDHIENLPVPAQKIHVDTYGTLYPTQRRASSISRPSIKALMGIYFPTDVDEDEPAHGGGSSGLGGKSLSGFDPDNQAQSGDEKNLSDEQVEAIKALVESFGSPKSSKSKTKSVFDAVAEETDEKGPADSEASNGVSKAGTLREYWAQAAKKEEIFKTHQQITKEEKIRWAYEAIKGINPNYARGAFGPSTDAVGAKVKEIEELYLNDGIIESFIASSQNDVRGELVDLMSTKQLQSRSVIPGRPTRHGYGLLALRYSPLFYTKDRTVKERQRKNSVVYVDFSGSMGNEIKWLMGLLPQLENRCNSDIWVFSTEIVQSSAEEFRKGKYSTTGGTSFNAVVDHAVDNNLEAHNFLIITDGIDALSADRQKYLRASGKNAYMLIVGKNPPSPNLVKIHQPWCNRVFLKEKSWWKTIGLSPTGRG